GVQHMRELSLRSGGTTEVRSIHERQDVCELSSSTHLRGAQEGGPGRQVITISRRGILELLAGASALTALETCHRMPRECTTGCRRASGFVLVGKPEAIRTNHTKRVSSIVETSRLHSLTVW